MPSPTSSGPFERGAGHADQLAERIVSWAGAGLLSRRVWSQPFEYVEVRSCRHDGRLTRSASRSTAIGRIQYVADDDPTTRRMLESILAVEEEHADELSDLLQGKDGA